MPFFIDISVQLDNTLPTWPGSVGYDLSRTRSIANGDSTTDSHLSCDVHVGTHIDAPAHVLPNGATIEALPLENLIGPAVVAEHTGPGHITADVLDRMEIPCGTKRLLFKTRNSALWQKAEFDVNFIALTADAAEWVVRRGILLVGIDYLSIEPYGQKLGTHTILLQAGVTLLEGLNMAKAAPGTYKLICLPINLAGAEGAPARALLSPLADIPETA